MVKRRKAGMRSNVLLDDVDLDILKILFKSDKELSIGDIQEMLNMSHVSFKVHVRRLIALKFITKERLPKKFKFILIILPKGKEIVRVFEN